MAHELHIDPEREVAAIRYTGFVTGREIVEAIGEMLRHPDWQPGFRRFSSTAEVTTMDVTPADLEAMQRQDVERSAEIGAGRKAVVVAPKYEVVSVMYKHTFDRKFELYDLSIFTDEAAAWDWLLAAEPPKGSPGQIGIEEDEA